MIITEQRYLKETYKEYYLITFFYLQQYNPFIVYLFSRCISHDINMKGSIHCIKKQRSLPEIRGQV